MYIYICIHFIIMCVYVYLSYSYFRNPGIREPSAPKVKLFAASAFYGLKASSCTQTDVSVDASSETPTPCHDLLCESQP